MFINYILLLKYISRVFERTACLDRLFIAMINRFARITMTTPDGNIVYKCLNSVAVPRHRGHCGGMSAFSNSHSNV